MNPTNGQSNDLPMARPNTVLNTANFSSNIPSDITPNINGARMIQCQWLLKKTNRSFCGKPVLCRRVSTHIIDSIPVCKFHFNYLDRNLGDDEEEELNHNSHRCQQRLKSSKRCKNGHHPRCGKPANKEIHKKKVCDFHFKYLSDKPEPVLRKINRENLVLINKEMDQIFINPNFTRRATKHQMKLYKNYLIKLEAPIVPPIVYVVPPIVSVVPPIVSVVPLTPLVPLVPLVPLPSSDTSVSS